MMIRARVMEAAAALLLLVWTAVGCAAPAYQLQASVTPPNPAPGDTVVYAVTISFTGEPPPVVPPPRFEPAWGLSQPAAAGRQTRTEIINGTISQTVEFRYSFTVSKEGNYILPPTGFTTGGQRYETGTVPLVVKKFDPGQRVPQSLEGKVAPPRVDENPELRKELTGAVFVLPVLEKSKIYEGEQVVASFFLCLDQQVLNKLGLLGSGPEISAVAPPKLSGFLRDEMFPVPERLKPGNQKIDDRVYAVMSLYQVALTPTKTGKIPIEPFQVQMWFQARGRARDPFFNDPLFSDMGGFALGGLGTAMQVIALSPALEVEVLPLPREGRPAGFTGAVGDFQVTATVDQRQVKENDDLLRLQVVVEGEGDASVIGAPELNIEGLRPLEPPKSTVKRRTDDKKRITTKMFDYLFRAVKSGSVTIPPVTLDVFDPDEQKYQQVASQPIPVQVLAGDGTRSALVASAPAGSQTAAPSGASAGGDTNPGEAADDLHYIISGPMGVVGDEFPGGFGALAATLAAGPLLLGIGWLVGRRAENSEDGRRAREIRTTNTMLRRRLREAAALAGSGKANEFHESLAGPLRAFLGTRLGLDPKSMTLGDAQTALEELGADEEVLETLREIFEDFDAVQYSPVKPGPAQMQESLERVSRLADTVDRLC